MSKSKDRPTPQAADQAQVRPNDAAKHIPIALIDPKPHQPRHEITPEDVRGVDCVYPSQRPY